MPSARRVSWAKFRVTVVSCVAVLILSTLVYLLTGSTLFHEQAHIYIYMPDATGISPDSPVEVNGITVGQVEAVGLSGSNDPNRVVKVTLDVLRERLDSVSEDSHAEVASDSLVGDKLIEIISGKSSAALRPGAEMRFQPPTDLMRGIDITQFETELRSVDAMLTDIEQGKSSLGQFILRDQMYNDVLKRVGEIERAIRAAVVTTSTIGEALYTDRLYDKIRDPIVQVDQSLARIQSGQDALGHFVRDSAQYDSLRREIADLRKSIADLREGQFLSSDQMYTDWNRNLAKLIETVDEMNANPMFNTTDTYDSLNGAVKEMQDTLKTFRVDPRKYLRMKVF